MRKVLASLFVAAAVGAVAFPTQMTRVQASAAAQSDRAASSARFVPNEILVKFKAEATEEQRANARARV